MAKTLLQLPSLDTPADDDLLLIEDISGGGTKSITRQNFLKGVVVQEVMAKFSDVATGTTTIPKDNTIPQNTEGTEFMTLAFTPLFADSTIEIEVLLFGSLSTTNDLIAALFKDSDAGALAASAADGAANNVRNIKLGYSEPAGTATERTYRVRAGGSAASTVTFNGASSARLFGDIAKSYVLVREIGG